MKFDFDPNLQPFQEVVGPYLLDGRPYRGAGRVLRAQLIIRRLDGPPDEVLFALKPDLTVFEDDLDAAEFALRVGERWVGTHGNSAIQHSSGTSLNVGRRTDVAVAGDGPWRGPM